VLASILPGLRELRTPLTVGYAWMLVAYLAFGYSLPKPEVAQGPLADLYAVAEVVTPAGLVVVASVAAYLIGIMVLPLTSAATAWLASWRGRVEGSRLLPWAIRHRFSTSDRVREGLAQIITDRLADRLRDEPDFRAELVRHIVDIGQSIGADFDPERLDAELRRSAQMRAEAVTDMMDVDRLVEEVKDKLALMAQRMRRADDRAGAEYDRLRSEAEFRGGMAWPLLGLFATLSVRASGWFAFGVLGVLLVLRSAASARQEAQVLLTSVLAARGYEDRALRGLDGIGAGQLFRRTGEQWASWAIPAARQATALAVSPDGAVIAAGMNDGRIHLWDAASGSLVLSLDAHRDEVRMLVLTPDGSRLISVADPPAAMVWQVPSGRLLCRLEHDNAVTGIGFDPAGNRVVTSTLWHISWFAVADGERLRRVPIGMSFHGLAVGPDGTVAIAGDDGIFSVSASGGEPERLGGPHAGLNWLHWLGKGRLLSISSETMMVWEQGPSKVVPLAEPPDLVAIAAGSETVVVSRGDNEIAVAGAPLGTRFQAIGEHRSTIKALACSADGSLVVSSSEEGVIVVWDAVSARRRLHLSVTGGREAPPRAPAEIITRAGEARTGDTGVSEKAVHEPA
jgi:hypothetical protein